MNKENTKKGDSENDIIDIRSVFARFAFHWPLYLLGIAGSIVLANLYLHYSKPVYSSSAKIYIKNDHDDARAGSLYDISGFTGGKVVENEMELIVSPLILEDVIRDNKFNVRYYLKGKVVNTELYETSPLQIRFLTDSSKVGNHNFTVTIENRQQIKITYGPKEDLRTILTPFNRSFQVGKDQFAISYQPWFNRNNDKQFQITIDSIVPLVYAKSDQIQTKLSTRAGSVFELTYEDQVAKRAADLLNALMDAYNRYTLNDKNKSALNTIRFIDGRLGSLGDELNVLERDVENFKRSRGITELGESSRLLLDQAREADQRLSQSNIQLSVYDDVEKYINNPNVTAPFTPIGTMDPALANFIVRYQEAIQEKARLSLSVQPGNPIIDEVEDRINNLRRTIRNYIAGFRRNAITEKTGIQQRVAKVENMISKVPTYERQFIDIQRQLSVKEGLYNFLLQRKEEASVAYSSNMVDNKIISPAYIPTTPIKPKRIIVFVLFIFGALIFTTVYLWIKYLLNNRITNKKDINKITDLPVIAEIYRLEDQQQRKVVLHERSVLSEQVLNLRNNLRFLLSGVHHSPVILFTSSISGEGKTFISSHLANSLTYNNNQVILLELDLRKPKLSQSLGISNSSGLTNYLVGVESLEQITKNVSGNKNLFLIPSGPIPPNPIELIESNQMKLLFAALREKYSYIIIDTSPVGLVSDAKSLAPYVDCSLFVSRFNYTPTATFKEVMADIDTNVFNKMGIIFNGVDIDSGYGYSGYGYGYGNSTPKQSINSFFRKVKQRMF
jgi:capsular exopolysaccharide synthesis family protein